MSKKQQLTVRRLEYGIGMKAVNALLGLIDKMGFPLGNIERGNVLYHATRRKKLAEFGDSRFLRFFDHYLEVSRRIPLTAFGRVTTRQAALKALANRLMVERYVHKYPRVESIPIKRPLFIVGFPRTGTTLLHHLLSQDPGYRSLKFWELHTPVPVRLDDPEKDRARRVQIARRTLAGVSFVFPEMRVMHQTDPHTPEECWQLFYNSFGAMNMDLQSGDFEMGDWLFDQDMVWMYKQYKRYLQILAHRHPTRIYVLKCPEHLWFLDALLEVFPDAGIIQTHRDPYNCVASYCSMISLNRRMLYGKIEPHEVGKHISHRFLTGIQRAMKVRDERGDANFFDVDFRQLVKEPRDVIRAIKAWHGMDHDEESERRMDEWFETKRDDAKGKHVYTGEMWGLDVDDIHARYGDYIRRFNVWTKAAGIPGGDREKTSDVQAIAAQLPPPPGD
jgi:hypothetical protein